MPAGQRVVQVCLFLVAAIALFGGSVQLLLGQPDTTVRQHTTLILLIALAVFMAAVGRLISMAVVGLPQPHAVWLAYLGSELIVPAVMLWGYFDSRRSVALGAAHA
jgi:hypothetical protein